MDFDRRVPSAMLANVSAFLSGARQAAVAKGAATVVLLRDGSCGLEVYLLRRHLQMAFAAGMYAFPGGTVDRRDSDTAVGWAGPSPAEWARRLDCMEDEARALVCAAMRETFEESGILMAGATGDTLVDDTTGDEWEVDRAALVDRTLSFTTFLDRRGLVLRTDLLAAWAHWITPEFEPRRYDTRFFLALIPAGQLTRDVSGEADQVVWIRPLDAVAAVDEGRLKMLLPTYVTLKELATYASPAEALAAGESRVVTAIMPGVEIVDDQVFFTDTQGRSS